MKTTKAQILMFDSQKSLSLATKKYFAKHGMNITITDSFEELINQLAKELPDCLVLDPITQSSNIQKLTKKLKTNEITQQIPIIFLTAKGLTEDRITGYNNGCESYLSKPFDPEELYVIITNLLRRRKYLIKTILQIVLLVKEIKTKLVKKIKNYPHPQLKLYLTTQEVIILKNIQAGQTIKQIKSILNTSQRNIEKYLIRILDKFNIKRIDELKSIPLDTILILKQANDGNRTRE